MLSHLEKLERARVHLVAFHEMIADWLKKDPYDQVTKNHARPNDCVLVTVHWVNRVPLPLDDLCLLLGDALYNMRSALDHLAFALSVAHSGPTKAEAGQCSFPIHGGLGSYIDAGARSCRLMHPDVQDIMQSLQPYHLRGDAAKEHPLAVLNQLGNVDKHRRFVLTGSVSMNQTFTMLPESVDVELLGMSSEVRYGPFDDKSEVAAMLFRITGPNPTPKLNANIAVDVAFPKTGPAAAKVVIMEAEKIWVHIRDEIFTKFRDYL